MPAVMEAIDRMTTSEKFDTMNYLWSVLALDGKKLVLTVRSKFGANFVIR